MHLLVFATVLKPIYFLLFGKLTVFLREKKDRRKF